MMFYLTSGSYFLFFLMTALFPSESQAANFTDCGSTARDLEVSVSGCTEDMDECPFIADRNVTLSANFTSADDYSLGKLRLTGIIATIPIPFPVRPDVACENWGLSCPLQRENRYSMQLQLPILRAYPRISLEVRMQLVSEDSKKIICTEFPARIRSADPSEITSAEVTTGVSRK